MSRLYDTVEPSVIDEDMIQTAVEEQGPKDEAGRIAKHEGIDFSDVTSLRLDFKNILRIDNLWSFTSLTKLQLDNNIIEKIEGLDFLVNLIWLDLSFNNIDEIHGLEKLTNLEDITLYNNRITEVANLDNLKKLHVFSIGNNQLGAIDNLIYLRKFRDLRTLNLAGNPFCSQEEYKMFTIAYLPQIDFLDYRLIDQNTKAAAFEKYEHKIEKLLQDEQHDREKTEAGESRRKQLELHKEAYVEFLDSDHLFEVMYQEDSEGQKLAYMPSVDEMLAVYREKFVVVSKQIFNYGLQEETKRKAEVATFFECVEEATKDNKHFGQVAIEEFIQYKKKLFQELPHIQDGKILETRMGEYNKKVSDLWDKLMGYELQLVDQLEDATQNFERNLADMVTVFLEHVQGLIAQMRDFETNHHEKLLEIAIMTLEKVVKNELEVEIPEDLRQLFVDKDTIINAVSTSHDIHQLKIDQAEDDINQRINQWMTSLIESIHETEEVRRNRERVSEINNLVDHLRDEIDTLDLHQD